MSQHHYEDDRVIYRRHDPRLDPMAGTATVVVGSDAIHLRGATGDTRHWPFAEVMAIEHGVLDGLNTRALVYGVRFWVRDPEGVTDPGLSIELACRNDYFAAVLARRIGVACDKTVEKTWQTKIEEMPF